MFSGYGGGGQHMALQSGYGDGGHQACEEHKWKQQTHECTDCGCCICFIVALVFWGIAFSYGLINGNIEKMFHGIQSVEYPAGSGTYVNSICGVDTSPIDVSSKPLLYWCMQGSVTSILSGAAQQKFYPVCTSVCPSDSGATNALGMPTLDAPAPECTTYGYSQPGTPGYVTINLLDKYCLPNVTASPYVNITDIVGGQVASTATEIMESMASIQHARGILIAVFFISILLGYVFLCLLHQCAEPLIWITIIASIVGFISVGAYLLINRDSLQQSADQNLQRLPDQISDNTANGALVGGIICLLFGFVLVCLVCCFRSSIQLCAAVVKVSCVVIWEMYLMLVLPVMKACIKGLLSLIILVGFLYLWTTADPETVCGWSTTCQGDGISRRFDHTSTENGLIWYFVFASLWILAFTNALYQFVIAYMVGDYYYTMPEHDGYRDVNQCGAMCTGFRYGLSLHAGSLAFGSLLIAILQFIQKALEWAEKKNKDTANNCVVTCIIASLLCCFRCCEEVIQEINKNAYIDIAISGVDNFCQACKNVFAVLMSKGAAMALLNGATFVLSLFGTLFIVVGSCFIALCMMNLPQYQDYTGSDQTIPDKVAVLICAAMISLLVAICFMHIFDMTSDTLIYCVGYDTDHNRPLDTAPPELRELYGNLKMDEASGKLHNGSAGGDSSSFWGTGGNQS